MCKLAVLVCFALVVASANAQTNQHALTLSGVIDCLKEAIGTSAVEADGNVLIFSCDAAKAKTLYNFIGRKSRAEVVLDRNGKFENRQFGNNACYHRIEDPSGNAVDDFRCDVIVPIGDALTD